LFGLQAATRAFALFAEILKPGKVCIEKLQQLLNHFAEVPVITRLLCLFGCVADPEIKGGPFLEELVALTTVAESSGQAARPETLRCKFPHTHSDRFLYFFNVLVVDARRLRL